jgi:hypothetical protein
LATEGEGLKDVFKAAVANGYAVVIKGLRPVDKQKKTAAELEEIVKQRIGAGDLRVTIHRNPDAGWHATIYGRHRPRSIAAKSWQTIAAGLCQHYELDE